MGPRRKGSKCILQVDGDQLIHIAYSNRQMNDAKQKPKGNEGKKETPSQMDSTNFMAKACLKEDIILEEPEDCLPDVETYTKRHNPELFTSPIKTEEDETQSANEDALLAAWWNYKRANKQKKKKRKILEIYRDENYWTDGRYTDDEDFSYPE